MSPSIDPPGTPGRRKRYRGSHPRGFDEKYKERKPEAFPELVEKVISRGQTPAGTHRAVLIEEVVQALQPTAGEVYVDATLGHGDHLERIVERVLPGGRALGLDLDPEALESTAARLLARGIPITARRSNFAGLGKTLALEGLRCVDLLLADLGVSSMQIDDPARGFSFKREGPLDLRMDRTRGVPAADWIASLEEDELRAVLERHGDEPDAPRIAALAKAASSAGKLRSTFDLVREILRAKGLGTRWRASSPFDQHPAARTFQAFRIAINREDENLRQLLRAVPYLLSPGGRVAIITFHGGEDRTVAAAFQAGLEAGLYAEAPSEPIRPQATEVRSNPRCRSARLRWAKAPRELQGS